MMISIHELYRIIISCNSCENLNLFFLILTFTGSKWTSTTLAPRSTKQNEEQQTPIDDDDIFRLLSYNDEAIQQISDMLMQTLRDAKKLHLLPCTEVLLPCELLRCVSVEMLKKSENEACGIRGCNIIIEFEDERGQKRQIASTKTDQNTVSTFELILELKQDRSAGWTTFLPQFLKYVLIDFVFHIHFYSFTFFSQKSYSRRNSYDKQRLCFDEKQTELLVRVKKFFILKFVDSSILR